MKEVYNVAEYESLSIMKTADVKDVFNQFFLERSDICKGGIVDVDKEVQKLKDGFEKDYAQYSAHLNMGQVGWRILTATNNKSMHNAIKNYHGMSGVRILMEFVSKMCDYFV